MSVGFVPTMGGLHEGHLSLIDAAKAACDFVVVSIFVNPTQFAPGEDLDTYPRTPEADTDACKQRGVDLVFMPTVETMYPGGAVATVSVGKLGEGLCGRTRPAHFAGVCTVVANLFNIVQPDKAFFGAKDFQQAVIVRRMASELNIPVEIVRCPIVREADGLAMSTRNAYLSADQREQAVALHGSLQLAQKLIRQSGPPAPDVAAEVREYLRQNAPDGEIDYVEIVEPQELTSVEIAAAPVLVAVAVKFGGTRLIDNVLVDVVDAGN
jgi:pantoate--beta-alanine ligase